MDYKNYAFLYIDENEKTIKSILSENSRLEKVIDNKILKQFESGNFKTIYDIPHDTRIDILTRIERIGLIIRSSFADDSGNRARLPENERQYSPPDYPIHIFAKEKELRVLMPFTVAKKYGKRVPLADYLKDAFYHFHQANPDVKLERLIKPPYIAVVKRNVKHSTALRLQDNDNYEVSRFINVIATELNTTDNPLNMIFAQCYSALTVVEDPENIGIEILVCELEDFGKYLDELKVYP